MVKKIQSLAFSETNNYPALQSSVNINLIEKYIKSFFEVDCIDKILINLVKSSEYNQLWQKLVKFKIIINQYLKQENLNNTLKYAALFKTKDIIKYLLELGADPKNIDQYGSVLHYLVMPDTDLEFQNVKDIYNLLKKYKLDPKAKNDFQLNALQLASFTGCKIIGTPFDIKISKNFDKKLVKNIDLTKSSITINVYRKSIDKKIILCTAKCLIAVLDQDLNMLLDICK